MFASNGVTNGLFRRDLRWPLSDRSKIFSGAFALSFSLGLFTSEESEFTLSLSISWCRESVSLIVAFFFCLAFDALFPTLRSRLCIDWGFEISAFSVVGLSLCKDSLTFSLS